MTAGRSKLPKGQKKPRKRAQRTAKISAKSREILVRTNAERARRDAIIATDTPMPEIDALPVVELGPPRRKPRRTRMGGEETAEEDDDE